MYIKYLLFNGLDDTYKYILHVICPFEIKEDIKQYLQDNPKILNNRISTKIEKRVKETMEQEQINLQANIDINQSFKDFLDITELRFPKENYIEVMKGVI